MNGHLQELKCGGRPMNKKELEQELQKYKSLYENEKDHTDTLKRIIKKIEECIKSQEYFYNDGEESGWDCSIDGYKILDLLKEIK